MARSSFLPVVVSAVVSAGSAVAQPANDLCANRQTMSCDSSATTGTLTNATDKAPQVNKRPEVYYELIIQGQRKKVTICITGLAGVAIPQAALKLERTNAAAPCAGPFKWIVQRSIGAAGNKQLDIGESICFTTECLRPATYLIAVDGKPPLANGDYDLTVDCEDWVEPNPGNGDSADGDGEEEEFFIGGDDVYFIGVLSPDVYNDI